MTLFCIFKNLFNVWYNKRQLDSHICSVLSRLSYVVLVTVCEKNQDLYRYKAGKKRRVLITFSDNYGYSLILHHVPCILIALGTLEDWSGGAGVIQLWRR